MSVQRLKKILVVCKHPENSKESSVCKLIIKEGFEVRYAWKNTLTRKELSGIDFVVSIGGDGTALTASHYLTDIPLLAVNSDPKKSEGALTTLNADELMDKLEEISKGNYKIEKLERIESHINGKKLDMLALNDVFVANEKAHLVSKYRIKIIDGRTIEEEQRSSGIIFSTGIGSTAWFSSAGGKPFSPHARYIELIIREPYFGRLGKFSLT